MEINNLTTLSKDDIINNTFPLLELLANSAYYPSAGFDGGVIKYCNTRLKDEGIISFIYCDYASEEGDVVFRAATEIKGYHVFAHRTVQREEVGATGPLPINFSMTPDEERKYMQLLANKPRDLYCHWLVMERDENFGEEHGPKRFSLLYVRGEGVATYAGLYAANKVSPKALAIIQPGHGFGGNWTDFTSTGACLYKFLKSNPGGMPTYVFNGGIGCNYDDLDWPDYVIVNRVQSYYSFHYGAMTVYRHDA